MKKPRRKTTEYPDHPGVDWSTLRLINGRSKVDGKCLGCRRVRVYDAPTLAHHIRQGKYSGYCRKDRVLKNYPQGPGVDYSQWKWVPLKPGNRIRCVKTTCQQCNKVTWRVPSDLQKQIKNGTFKGKCKVCAMVRANRWICPSTGYINLCKGYVDMALWPLWDKFVGGTGGGCKEHRWVMSLHLNRRLERGDVVHHRNGIRHDNRIENLQLMTTKTHYKGHCDHYDEIERLKARIRQLEALLATTDAPQTK